MLVAKVLAALVKPALLGGAIAVAGSGAYVALNGLPGGSDTTAFRQIQDDGTRLVISEFSRFSDALIAVDPNDVTQRTTLATIDHADGFGIFATLAPDGGAIAYTALPPDMAKPAPDSSAQAAIIDADGNVTLLADDVDLLVPPLWAPDGSGIVVRKNTPEEDGAGSFELTLLGRDGSRALLTAWTSAAVFPIAFSPDGGTLYFATLNASGTDLYAVTSDGASETFLARLSDELSRGWRLSPDGTRLAYSHAETGPQPRIVTKIYDFATGDIFEAAPLDGSSGELSPAWSPAGALTIASLQASGGGGVVALGDAGAATIISTNTATIDLPLEWSRDGSLLAVRAVEGAQPFEAGSSHVELIDAAGGRSRVSDSPDVLVAGWLE